MEKSLQEGIESIKVRLSNAIKADPTLGEDIEKLHTLLADAVTPPAPTPTLKEAKTAEGVTVYIAVDETGSPKVGNGVFSDAEGKTAVSDGPYILEDGSKITVVGGLITEIVSAGTPAPDMPDMAQMKSQLDAQTAEITNLKSQLEKESKDRAELVSIFKRILETPVEAKMAEHKKITEQDIKNMTALEYRQYLRSLDKK